VARYFSPILPKLAKYLNQLATLSFVASFLIATPFFGWREYRACKDRLTFIDSAVMNHLGSQGLVVGSAGFASIFSSLVENDGKYFIENISISRAGGVVMDRSFFPGPQFSVSKKLGLRSSFAGDFDEFKLECIIDFSNSIAIAILINSFLSSLALVLVAITVHRFIIISLEKRSAEQVAQVAEQVAHDIRSPLAALKVASKDLGALPEETRILINAAMNRISDIANQLLQKKSKSEEPASAKQISTDSSGRYLDKVFLPALIGTLISEKQLEYQSKAGLEIKEISNTATYAIFVRANSIELKRVLSNLINNAVESLDGPGKVSLCSSDSGDVSLLEIRDTGKGIPPDILKRLGQRGETHGKIGGTGLGLYFARSSVEKWGGTFEIRSQLYKGTSVLLQFPLVSPPSWFATGLQLKKNARLIIIDDDVSIYKVWEGKLLSLQLPHHGIELTHFSSVETFSTWAKIHLMEKPSVMLIDYQFSGERKNGLDIIQEFGLNKSATLITSRYEEDGILARSHKLGVKMIPKEMIYLVPVTII
jgi:signal transduction histidine kinase